MTRMLVLVALLSPVVLAIGEDTTICSTRIFEDFKAGRMESLIAMSTDDIYVWWDPSVPIVGGAFHGVAGMTEHLENMGHSVDISKFEYNIESADEFRRTTHSTWLMEGTVRHTGKPFTTTGVVDMTWSRETPAKVSRIFITPNDSNLKIAMKMKAELAFDIAEQAFVDSDVPKFKSMFNPNAKFECNGDYPGCEDKDYTVDGFLAFISTNFDFSVLRSEVIVGTDEQVVVSFSHNYLRSKFSGKSLLMNEDDTVMFVFTLGSNGKFDHYEMTFTTDPSPWAFHVAPAAPTSGKSPKGDL